MSGTSLADWNGENHRSIDDQGRSLDEHGRPISEPPSPRLHQLRALTRGMSVAQEGLLYGHLLGNLSGLIDGDQWDEALEQALTYSERETY